MSSQADKRIWLLRLVLPGRWGRWLTSLLVFSCMFLLLGSAGVWTDILPDSARSSRSASFFFCVILAYIIPVFHFICERSQTALCALSPVLDLDVEQIALQERALIHKPRLWRLIVLSAGLLAGSAHNAVLWIANGDVPVSSNIGTWVVTVFATMAVWLVMTTVVFALVHNASLIARLSKRLKIDLLNTQALKPFATSRSHFHVGNDWRASSLSPHADRRNQHDNLPARTGGDRWPNAAHVVSADLAGTSSVG